MSMQTLTINKQSRRINVILHNNEPGPLPHAEGDPHPSSSPIGRTLPNQEQYAAIFKELDDMIGLEQVKDTIYEIYALLLISQYRTEAGLPVTPQVYHMVFTGNPGTGKTTVARIVARLLQAMGLLAKGHMIEAERADLVGEYIGHTAMKTRDLVKKALGGVLFIDEAYSLARGGEKDFGKEAIDTLVKAMEDYKSEFVLILAGYPYEMEEFIATNPGLPSRFPIRIDFPDYTIDQLLGIAEQMVKERCYTLSPQSVVKLRQYMISEKNRNPYAFSNARFVRNILERTIRHQAVRLANHHHQPSRQELMTIRPDDIRLEQRGTAAGQM